MRHHIALSLLLSPVVAVYEGETQKKRLVLNVNFETAKDYDITSAYAVRGWNTTEGHMKITCPSPQAKHGGRFGMEVAISKAFTKNFHAQFSMPHFMTRLDRSGYQLTFWAKLHRTAGAGEVRCERMAQCPPPPPPLSPSPTHAYRLLTAPSSKHLHVHHP